MAACHPHGCSPPLPTSTNYFSTVQPVRLLVCFPPSPSLLSIPSPAPGLVSHTVFHIADSLAIWTSNLSADAASPQHLYVNITHRRQTHQSCPAPTEPQAPHSNTSAAGACTKHLAVVYLRLAVIPQAAPPPQSASPQARIQAPRLGFSILLNACRRPPITILFCSVSWPFL